jgi:hypothetical protein
MAANELDMLVSHIRHLTDRRQNVTSTYLSVNAALIAAMAFLFKDGQVINLSAQISFLALLISGIVACSLWRRLITQLSTVIAWWYWQLRLLEDSDPQSNKLITKEYQELYLGHRNRAAIGLTRYETALTWLFTLIYLVFCIVILASMTLHFK